MCRKGGGVVYVSKKEEEEKLTTSNGPECRPGTTSGWHMKDIDDDQGTG